MGIGNALVDVLTHEDDAFIEANGLVKGSMTLIDTERAEALYAAMGRAHRGVGRLGRQHDLRHRQLRRARPPTSAGSSTTSSARCSPTTSGPPAWCSAARRATEGPPTGRCLIVVTPDAERTMNTYLGASEFLGPEDVDGDLIAAAQVTYLEGYLFDRPEAQEAYWKASRIAHDAGRRVSLTLSDTFCVERHKRGLAHRSSPTRSTSSSPTRARRWRSTTSTPSTRRSST